MSLKEIPLAEATPKQLAEFCTNVLGMEGVTYQMGRDKILAKLKTVSFGKDTIFVSEQPMQMQGEVMVPPAKDDEKLSGKKVIIHIHDDGEEGESRPVPVGVNGRLMLIPRGEDVTIPIEYKEVLDHAKKSIPIRNRDNHITGWRDVHQYGYNVVGYAN